MTHLILLARNIASFVFFKHLTGTDWHHDASIKQLLRFFSFLNQTKPHLILICKGLWKKKFWIFLHPQPLGLIWASGLQNLEKWDFTYT